MAMKNFKKLISGVVAMMAVATAVGATPQKVPVEVLDVADATGIATEGVVNEIQQAAADEGGYWTFTTGSGTASAAWCWWDPEPRRACCGHRAPRTHAQRASHHP